MRDLFLKWDADQDGFIDATEMRKGLGMHENCSSPICYISYIHRVHKGEA
jgi:hypothetical protein